jgi:hypothetical protein
MSAPAYGTDEVCHHHVLPPGARVLFLSSHVHQRGRRFRIFHGNFACRGGRNSGEPCSPFGPDEEFATGDICAGAPCTSQLPAPPPMGDCDESLDVSVEELVLGVRIALGQASVTTCPQADRNSDAKVTIDELLGAVHALLHPDAGEDPRGRLLYTSLTYADPFTVSLDPPRVFGGPRATVAERTLTYCALYDNGFTDPDTVKRNSQLPTNSPPCQPTHCAEGAVGERCVRHVDCNTESGAGLCDACTVGFGLTTDDEMFVLVGAYLPPE